MSLALEGFAPQTSFSTYIPSETVNYFFFHAGYTKKQDYIFSNQAPFIYFFSQY